MAWGDETEVRKRFGAAGIAAEDIAFERATWRFRQSGSPSELLATFREFYGPAMNAFEAAAKNGRAGELGEELELLFASQNQGGPHTDIPSNFLKVTVSVR